MQDIQSRLEALLGQTATDPTNTSDDWYLRREYINMAQNEWAELCDWQALYKEYNALVSTSTGNASIVLPSDFRKLASYPKITYDGANTSEFPEVRPQENGRYLDTDKRINIYGNPADGYTLRVHGCSLTSGASVTVPYYASPASLVSPADISMCPDSDYLTKRALAYVWEARGDERFPLAKAEAEKVLSRLLETEETRGEAYFDRVQTTEEKRYNFKIGRD